MIQHPIPLQLQHPTITLNVSSLNSGPPQEIPVVQVTHRVVDVICPLTIQAINNSGVLGIGSDNVGAKVRVLPLVGVRDRHIMNVISVLRNSRHGNRWRENEEMTERS